MVKLAPADMLRTASDRRSAPGEAGSNKKAGAARREERANRKSAGRRRTEKPQQGKEERGMEQQRNEDPGVARNL